MADGRGQQPKDVALEILRMLREGEALPSIVGRLGQALFPAEPEAKVELVAWCIDPGLLFHGAREPILLEPLEQAPLRSALFSRAHPLIEEHRWTLPLHYAAELVGALRIDATASALASLGSPEALEPVTDALALGLWIERSRLGLEPVDDRLCALNRLELVSELAATSAHELNNVLSAIIGRSQLLYRGPASPELRRSLKVIERAALDGAALAERLQATVRGDPVATVETITLPTLVEEALARAETRVARHDGVVPLEATAEITPTPPIRGDATALRQLLTNLLYNAVDAMPKGGRLVARCGTEGSGRQVWLEVEDTGVGMDRATRARALEPFFTTKGEQGTGLGLSVSQRIAARHGGHLEIDSTPGEGTRVRVWLPVGGPPSSEPADPPSSPPSPSGEVGKDRGRRLPARILVIDDDRAVLETLTEILEAGGHQVVAAPSGPAGLAMFKDQAFDLVFTDLGMPGMNGWEVAAQIRASSPATPVGIITGWETRIDRPRLRSMGVELVVGKPFRFQQVLDLVSQTLAERTRGASS